MKRKRTSSAQGGLLNHPVILCVGSALLCCLFVFLYMQRISTEAEEARAEMLARYGGEQVEVCVATKNIEAGEEIDASCVTTKRWIADLLPQDAIRIQDDVVGSVANSLILAGEVFSTQRLGITQTGIAVPENMTALSVPAKQVQAVGGAIVPGMLIDIYATGSTSTTLIGRNVLVLATSSVPTGEVIGDYTVSEADVTWITVCVEPDRVQELVAAAQKLSLYFALPGKGVSDE